MSFEGFFRVKIFINKFINDLTSGKFGIINKKSYFVVSFRFLKCIKIYFGWKKKLLTSRLTSAGSRWSRTNSWTYSLAKWSSSILISSTSTSTPCDLTSSTVSSVATYGSDSLSRSLPPPPPPGQIVDCVRCVVISALFSPTCQQFFPAQVFTFFSHQLILPKIFLSNPFMSSSNLVLKKLKQKLSHKACKNVPLSLRSWSTLLKMFERKKNCLCFTV